MKDLSKELTKYLNYNYPVEILKLDDEEGGGYVAEIPFLGRDAFTGHGETIEEALQSLNEIKEFLFEDYMKNGINIPPPPKDEDYSGKFVLRVPKYLHKTLAEDAQRNGVSLNTYCLSLLSQKAGTGSIKAYLDFLCKDLQLIKAGLGDYIFTNVSSLSSSGPVKYDSKEWMKYGRSA